MRTRFAPGWGIAVLLSVQVLFAQMKVGANFWFFATWSGDSPFVSNINWSTAWGNHQTACAWNPAFLDEVKIYNALRFMDWGCTNVNPDSLWTQRTLPTDNQYKAIRPFDIGGAKSGCAIVAYEWMCDLCNWTGANMWVCIPLYANDDYITQMATLLKNTLLPPRKIYLEYGNEDWYMLSGPGQQLWRAKYGGNDWGDCERWNALRCIQMWTIFKTVFGSDFESRVVRLIGGQLGNTGVADPLQVSILSNPSYNPQGFWPQYYTTATYVNTSSPGAFAGATQEMIRTGMVPDLAIPAYKSRGVTHVSYEGGLTCDNMGSSCPSLMFDNGMYQAYLTYLDQLNAAGEKLFMQYTHCSACTGDNSCWGLKSSTGQDPNQAPKYRGVMDWIKNHNAGPDIVVDGNPYSGVSTKPQNKPAFGALMQSQKSLNGAVSLFDLQGRPLRSRGGVQGGKSPQRIPTGVYIAHSAAGAGSEQRLLK